jgi:formamidopyrimidine-DNA glycosylase
MFELPEFLTLARQMRDTLVGKVVQQGVQGNSPHKFVWYNRTPAEFQNLTLNKTVGQAHAWGRWLFIPLEPGYVLVFGECGGKILYHADNTSLPKKYHLYLSFQDGSGLTATTQMWGAMELYEQGQECNRQYIRGMRPTPVEPQFTFEYFSGLIDELVHAEKRSVKGLLTQEQLVPGLGNAIAQDILFKARLHPKHPIDALDPSQRQLLYHTIVQTVAEVTGQGGRYDETDLYNKPGGYRRLMDSQAAGHPCPECGQLVEKIQYLGGACYFCPNCQV